jgi:starch synthase
MRRTAMARTFGWDKAATSYSALYARTMGNGEVVRFRAA